MENNVSFTIDLTRLLRGIYVSRKDVMEGGAVVTTFDIRMKLPNREPAVSQSALHTIDHLASTFLRNHPVWGPRIIYWGPMSCCTGNYLLVKGNLTAADIAPLVRETFEFIADYDGEIPGANAHDCGNYMLNNLPMAKWEARKYLVEVLNNLSNDNLNYPE
ncbi:MAG: S-ribosylhomocysteine lyase [Muribaculaceae bacterium]|nr:S-ribosylhomocysteine lyase [Muribaculaceae bacterium]